MPSTLEELHKRLTEAEKLFLAGHFQGAEAECKAILSDPYTKTDKQLHAHTAIVSIQAMFELKKSTKEIDGLMLGLYGSIVKMPYEVFSVWFQFKLHQGDLRSALKEGIDYISQNKHLLEQRQYDEFVQHFVFHCLTELGEYKQAMKFLKINTFLSPEKKEEYITELNRILKEKAVDMSKFDAEKGREGNGGGHGKDGTSTTKGGDSKDLSKADNGDSKITGASNRGAGATRWQRIILAFDRAFKRLKQAAPMVFLLVFVGFLMLLMKNAATTINIDTLRAEAKRFLSLFFALGPNSA